MSDDQDREILAAAPKDSDDWDNATWAAWWRTSERHHPKPMPVSDQPQPLNDIRLAEIQERASKRAAALTAWLDKFSPLSEGQREVENAETVLEEDVPALLAEVKRLKGRIAELKAEVLREAATELAAQADDLWAPGSIQHTVMRADADELRRIAADCKTPAAATSPAATATSTQSGGAS